MALTTTVNRRIKVDASVALDWLAAQAIGIIQRRTRKGLEVNGTAFTHYSKGYQRQLVRMGESTFVDLTVTGALVNDLVVIAKDETSITIGPGIGTSERVKPPSMRTKTGKKRKKPAKARAVRTGQRSPPHNVLGKWLHYGDKSRGLPARPWLGLSHDERVRLAKQLAKRCIVTIARGGG